MRFPDARQRARIADQLDWAVSVCFRVGVVVWMAVGIVIIVRWLQ